MDIPEGLPSANGNEHARIELDLIPFIQTEWNPDEYTRGRIVVYASESHTVIFTSSNAVKAVTSVLQTRPDWKIYCVGAGTRKRIAAFFGESAILDEAANAEDLSEKIIGQRLATSVIFFCGDQRRNLLPDKLRQYGIGLQEMTVYQTQLTPVALEKKYDAILFFSPTAVTSFFTLNKPSAPTVLFALGETTAAAIRRVADNEVLVSPNPDKEFLLQMAVDYGRSHPIS
jgi:uroporphyrinogen-III synthase